MSKLPFLAYLLALSILLVACSQPKPAPITTLPTTLPPTPTANATLTPASTPTPTPVPTPPPTANLTPTPPATLLPSTLYDGPLFETHMHLIPSVIVPRFGSADALLRYFDENQELWVVGFYTLPPDKTHRAVSSSMPIITSARSRIIPLVQPWSPATPGEFARGLYNEAVLQSYLQPQGPFQGVGELPFYAADFQTMTFESPAVQTVFQLVNRMKGIVMIHPSPSPPGQGRAMDVSELEPSISRYPDTIFLFHGGPSNFNLVAPLMSKYPNIYFTMDVSIWVFSGSWTNFVSLMDPRDGSPASGERFLADVSRIGVESILDGSLKRATPLLQQYPDRIMWGTDRGHLWHYEDSVAGLIIRVSRQFIARLPSDIQEKYAYRNALGVFERYLSPSR